MGSPGQTLRRMKAARAIHDAFAEGLLGPRAQAELTNDWTLVSFAAQFQEPLGIELALEKSSWGETLLESDFVLPAGLDSAWGATATERGLAETLVDDGVGALLNAIGSGATELGLQDR